MVPQGHHSLTSTNFQRFKLLLWKSYLWHRYYWWWTTIEIILRCLVPIYLGISLSNDIKFTVHLPTHPAVQTRKELMNTLISQKHIAYSPPNDFTDQLMENVRKQIMKEKDGFEPIDIVSMPNEPKLEEFIVNRSITKNERPMGVVFFHTKFNDDDVKVPHKLVFELRQSIATGTRWLIEGESELGPNKKGSDYWDGGFAALQLLINEEFIRVKMENDSWTPSQNMVFQPFPYPEYESSIIERENVLTVVVFTLIAAEVALSVPFIASIIVEKQNGVKNLMRIHHMEESLIWLGWFIKAFVVILASVTLTVIILKIPFKGHASESCRQSDFTVLWSFFLLFSVANLCLVLFLSALFNRAATASLVHMFVHYFSLVILFITTTMNLRKSVQIFWPSPSLMLLKGIRFFITAEVHGIPYTWSSVRKLHTNDSYITLLPYFIFFVFEIVFYSMLTMFFGFLNPGAFGTQKSLRDLILFVLFGSSKHRSSSESPSYQIHVHKPASKVGKSSFNAEVREPISQFHEPSLRIEGLHKEYDEIHVLERIDLEFYDNEICVLLGPKNAGKTTLFSILAGSIAYDDGHIIYKGLEVSDDLELFTSDLGICFKEDRLFHYMTVEQHLIFFGMLKGLSEKDAEEEADEYMIKLEIHDERNSPAKLLSKLMKRKLCIAICLIGERKVLILDEPLDGLDHLSKMKIWNLLSDMRTDRTIIISTSNAREAESLADRIAVMENGYVIAHGTPEYLKNSIGTYYELLVTTPKANFSQVHYQIMSRVNATVEREMENEIEYRIPSTEVPKFPALFENIEKNSERFEITNIELTSNTLEHVLMRTGGLSGDFSVKSESIPRILDGEHDPKFHDSIKGVHLRFLQLKILFWKKMLYVFKDYVSILKRIILPSIFAILVTRVIEEIDFKPFLVEKMSPSIYILSDKLLGTVFPQIMLHKLNSSDELQERYSSYLTQHGSLVINSEGSAPPSEERLLNYAKVDLMRFRKELLALFELDNEETIKVMYNLWALHSLPIAITVYSNVLLKNLIDDQTTEIVTLNHPVPSAVKGCDSDELFAKALIILGILYFTFAFLTMDVVLYLFELSNKELVDGLMYLQIMSGVPVWMYWFTTFIFDLLFFVIIVAFRLALFAFLGNYYYFFRFTVNFGYFVLVLFLFGISALFYVYIFSFFYRPTAGTYYVRAFAFNFACNVGVAMCYSFSLDPQFVEKPLGMYRLFSFIFFLIPFLNFPWTILQYMSQWYHNNQCFIICSELLESWCISTKQPKPYMEISDNDNVHGILLEVSFLFITFIFGFVLFILINTGIRDFFHNRFRSRKTHQGYPLFHDDIDRERDEIHNIKEHESRYHQVSLLVDGLGKNYVKLLRPMTAVDDVSFIAEHGTNFGILGEHESGKTTIFNMMAAKTVPTKGDVSVYGVSPNIDKMQYFSLVGYCPQTSPLLDLFTGREMLELIISLKGIIDVKSMVDEWIHFTGLDELQYEICDWYSNSSKRLLSVALSLVGNPRVVFLDEPTSDVDSLTRRHLYDIIEAAKRAGKTVALGSPSSTECELLCDRLIILINGVMHCIGSSHDLKISHSLGYFLMIKIHPEITSFTDVVRLEKSILNVFSSKYCRLLEEYRSLLHYQILDHSLSLSVLFKEMEEIKRHNPVIEEYAVTTTTLRDILESLSHPGDFFSSKRVTGNILSGSQYQKETDKITDA